MAVVTLPVNQILQGDALTRLRELPNDWIDCCVTSPPYWALRDYKVEGQLGSEPTFQQYLDDLIEIFTEVKRVIKPTGSIWVNIGDTYNSPGNTGKTGKGSLQPTEKFFFQGSKQIPKKSLCGIPERFKIKMIDELGLICRNTIIWYKPNCMPSSAKDRFTIDFEYIYFFTKSPKYYFETQYEPLIIQDSKVNNAKKMGWDGKSDYADWYFNKRKKKGWTDHKHDKEMGFGHQKRGKPQPPSISFPLGRQKRTVWKISTRAFSEAHFAVYPTQLIEPILKSVCPEFICNKCGKPRKLVYEETKLIPTNNKCGFDTDCKSRTDDDPHKSLHSSEWSKGKPQVVRMPKFGGNRAAEYGNPTYSGKEWNPVTRRLKSMGADSNGEYTGQSTKDYDGAKAQNASDTKRRILESYKRRANSDYVMTKCDCNVQFTSGIVLDPFFGAGTTGVVALQQNKQFVGIELNPEYIKIAKKRIEDFKNYKPKPKPKNKPKITLPTDAEYQYTIEQAIEQYLREAFPNLP